MKIYANSLALVVTLLLSGLLTQTTVTAQPYGYQPYGYPSYGQPAYPRGYQQPRSEAQSVQAEGSVTIISPEANAVVSSMQPLVVEYSVNPGPKGDHVHVYLDGHELLSSASSRAHIAWAGCVQGLTRLRSRS